jgi:hypothetical protein
VQLAMIAVPLVLLTQFFWPVELSKAVRDRGLIYVELLLFIWLGYLGFLKLDLTHEVLSLILSAN